MRNMTTEMTDFIATDGATLVTLWQLTTKDGLVVRSTDYSDAIEYYGQVFNNLDGMSRTAVQFNSNLTDDNLSASGFVNVFATREELLGGKYDYAEVLIFLINPFDHSMGAINLVRGNLGNIEVIDDSFATDLTSRINQLGSRVGLACSPSCRAQLGDAQCGVSLAAITTTGAVLGIGANTFAVSLGNSLLTFPQGKLTWTSGANNGGEFEVKNYSLGELTLYLKPNFDIELGDTFTIVQGCDKTIDVCTNTYGNAPNFRGEPDIPGADAYYTRIERRDTVSS